MQSNTNLHAEQYKFTCRAIQIYTQSNTNLHAEQYKFTCRAIQIYMQSNTNLLAEQYKFTCKAIQIYMQSNTNFRHIPLSSSNNEKCLREKFQRKFPEKIQTNIFKTFFPDNYAVYDKMWGKYVSRRGHRLQYDACVFHAGYLRLQYTGRICNADDLPLQQ